jgi:hypothetical protein
MDDLPCDPASDTMQVFAHGQFVQEEKATGTVLFMRWRCLANWDDEDSFPEVPFPPQSETTSW